LDRDIRFHNTQLISNMIKRKLSTSNHFSKIKSDNCKYVYLKSASWFNVHEETIASLEAIEIKRICKYIIRINFNSCSSNALNNITNKYCTTSAIIFVLYLLINQRSNILAYSRGYYDYLCDAVNKGTKLHNY